MGYFHFFSQNCLRQGNRTKNTYGGTQNSNPTQKEYSNGQVNLLRNFLQLLSCVRRVFLSQCYFPDLEKNPRERNMMAMGMLFLIH